MKNPFVSAGGFYRRDSLLDEILAAKESGMDALRNRTRANGLKQTPEQKAKARAAFDKWSDLYEKANSAYDNGDEKAAAHFFSQAQEAVKNI